MINILQKSTLHAIIQPNTVVSVDLQDNTLKRHKLAPGESLLTGGRDVSPFEFLYCERVGWRDELFYGIEEKNLSDHWLIVDPSQEELLFTDSTRPPDPNRLNSLDRISQTAVRRWMFQQAALCTDGRNPSVISSISAYNWSIPVVSGELGNAIYLASDGKLVRVTKDGFREVLTSTSASLKKKSIHLVAVSADEKFVAYVEVGNNNVSIGGIVEQEVHVLNRSTGRKTLIARGSDVGSIVWLADDHTLCFTMEGQKTGIFLANMADIF